MRNYFVPLRNYYRICKMDLSCGMPKSKETIRREVHLMPEVDEVYKEIADKEDRSVKYVMERFLKDNAEKLTGKSFAKKPKKAGRPKKQ